ncbi:hypothetical protein RB599_010248 [Gaeumannomyces hyphopodioides]
MNIIELYAVLIMGLLAICPCITLIFQTSRLSRILIAGFERFVQYPLAIKGSYSITRLELLILVAFLSCNLFVLVFRVLNVADFEKRTAVVSAINIIPLFLGGNPNPLLDLTGVSISSYHLIHHWIGGVAILEGLVHAGMSIRSGSSHSFPMLVMWHSSESLEGSENEIGFLISESGRFFNHSSLKIGKSLLLDGPYGRNTDLWNYETVILAAKGMGIAGILSSALFLLDCRNLDLVAKKQTKKRLFRDRTRKVALVWALEDNSQENWAALAIHNLQKVDKEKILLFWCIYPSEQTTNPPFQLGEHWKCFYSKKGQEGKYLNWVVSQDTRSPGRHVVMACGDSNFTSTARQIVIDQSREDYPIQFVESEYRPSSYGRGGKISELKLQEQGDARAKMTKKTGFHPAIKTKKAIA